MLTKLVRQNLLADNIGDEALRVIVAPQVKVRQNYPAGKEIVVSLDYPLDVNLSPDVLERFITIQAGEEVLKRFQTQSAIRRGEFQLCVFTHAVRSDGRVTSPDQEGDYSGELVLRYRVLPEPPYKLIWPTAGASPWTLRPGKVSLHSGKKASGSATYECEIRLLLKFSVVSDQELKRVEFLTGAELDKDVKAAFTSEGPARACKIPARGGIAISYVNLPASVALRAMFRDSNQSEHFSTLFARPCRAGTSGRIITCDMYDLFLGLAPGSYRGELILFTDGDVAYNDPGITNLWFGRVSFPIEFAVDEQTKK